MVECPNCSVINYLDPYTFWDFKGKVKCAGCEAVFAVEKENGQLRRGPEPAAGPPDRLPGYAQSKDYARVFAGPGKTNPPPMARADFQGRPIPITRNIRGRPVAGRPLKPEELIGSRARYIVEGKGE
jgi:hypothetical protein